MIALIFTSIMAISFTMMEHYPCHVATAIECENGALFVSGVIALIITSVINMAILK